MPQKHGRLEENKILFMYVQADSTKMNDSLSLQALGYGNAGRYSKPMRLILSVVTHSFPLFSVI
jgi:hypothetical protein